MLETGSPGFFYGFAWLLVATKGRCGSIPLPQVRICETILGRITKRECLAILLVHFVGTFAIFNVLKIFFPGRFGALAFDPVEYSQDENPIFVDFCQELLANSLFTVSILVLPVLLKMNRISTVMLVVLLYPLYSFAVDSSGQGSTFSPNALFALSLLNHGIFKLSVSVFFRIVGHLASGLVAGEIMLLYFPEDPKE